MHFEFGNTERESREAKWYNQAHGGEYNSTVVDHGISGKLLITLIGPTHAIVYTFTAGC